MSPTRVPSSQEDGPSRRDFLGGLFAGLAVSSSSGLLSAASFPSQGKSEIASSSPPVGESVSTVGVQTQTGTELLSRLNLYSAYGVTAGFLGVLGHAVLAKNGHLSLGSAAWVNSFEFARLGALAFGSQADRAVASREFVHLAKDAMPALAMIAASDFAERGIAIDPEQVAARLKRHKTDDTTDPKELIKNRPSLGEKNQEVWTAYTAKIQEQLFGRVAQMVAITSISAPLATTLTSAAFWKKGLDGVAHLCTELAYGRQVINFLERGVDPKEQLSALKALTATEVTSMINGPWGYNQLGIALACNGQGLFGVGTPPNFWFAGNHLGSDPVGWARSEVKGMLLSESQTILAASVWLSQVTGENFGKTALRLVRDQIGALNLLRQSFTDEELRSTTFGDGTRLANRIIPVLHKLKKDVPIDDLIRDLKQEVRSTPPAAIQLSLGEWFERMGQVYRRLANQFPALTSVTADIPDFQAEELDDLKSLRQGDFYESLQKAVSSSDSDAITDHLKKYQRWRQDRLSQRIAVVLHSIAADENGADIDALVERFGLTSDRQFDRASLEELDSADSRRVAKEVRFLSHTVGQVTSLSSERERLRAAQQLAHEGVELDSILQQLSYIHRATVKEACDKLVSIRAPLENVLHFLSASTPMPQEASERAQSAPEVRARNFPTRLLQWMQNAWQDPDNLSEASKDIVRVIATQVPATQACAISFSDLLKRYANVKPGEAVTSDQLKSILQVIPAFGYGVAALADNVPGYLILENVITGLFEQTYSPDILEKVPHIRSRIGFIGKVVASQSGMVFPFSSATNLLQDRVEIIPTEDENYPLGFGITRSKISTPDTTSSWYMRISAATTIGWAVYELLQIHSESEAQARAK